MLETLWKFFKSVCIALNPIWIIRYMHILCIWNMLILHLILCIKWWQTFTIFFFFKSLDIDIVSFFYSMLKSQGFLSASNFLFWFFFVYFYLLNQWHVHCVNIYLLRYFKINQNPCDFGQNRFLLFYFLKWQLYSDCSWLNNIELWFWELNA